ncbi:MAG: hypothetical protein OXC63_13220 [Aestuariivita sp.]|nr:hypothetical protein [Aestuariivita sp.]
MPRYPINGDWRVTTDRGGGRCRVTMSGSRRVLSCPRRSDYIVGKDPRGDLFCPRTVKTFQYGTVGSGRQWFLNAREFSTKKDSIVYPCQSLRVPGSVAVWSVESLRGGRC